MKRFLLVNTNHCRGSILPVQRVIFVPSFFSLKFLLKGLLIGIAILVYTNIYAQTASQQSEAEYRKVVTERSAKIINTLEITDSAKYKKVLNEVANQYVQLNAIHDQNKAAIADIKAKALPKEEAESAIKKQEEKKSSLLLQRHAEFITHLKEIVTEEQLEKIKDGMTYRVFPITYKAYGDMLLNLSKEQKEKIYNWLKEARELAMDEGSSEDKHKVFGKYKGKINNYLSSEGYDMKKEEKAWQERRKQNQ